MMTGADSHIEQMDFRENFSALPTAAPNPD